MAEELLEVRGSELSARGLHLRSRHTRRSHGEHAEREGFARIEHVANPGQAQHIGDLVRVRDDGRRPSWHDSTGELGHGNHAGLDVDMRIDQARAYVLAVQVDRLAGTVVTEPSDPSTK